jgi:hypothetical protein
MPDESRDPQLEWVRRDWEPPPPTAGFHNRVLEAYVREAERAPTGSPTRRKRKATWVVALLRMAAVTILAGAALLVIVTVALPQTGKTVSPPWTVDSEFISYDENGSSSIEMYMTSYLVDGEETVLSRVLPGSPFKAWAGRALEAISPLFVSADRLKREEKIRRSHLRSVFITRCNLGCLNVVYTAFSRAERQWTGCVPGSIVGRERILDRPAEAVRETLGGGRATLWTASDLGCFALRVTYELPLPDGTFRLVSEKRALRVNLNP